MSWDVATLESTPVKGWFQLLEKQAGKAAAVPWTTATEDDGPEEEKFEEDEEEDEDEGSIESE